MLPIMSFLTGVKAIEPRRSIEWISLVVRSCTLIKSKLLPKRVVNDSDASRKSEVGMALLFEESTGTLVNDFLRVSNQVPPGGIAAWKAIVE